MRSKNKFYGVAQFGKKFDSVESRLSIISDFYSNTKLLSSDWSVLSLVVFGLFSKSPLYVAP